MTNKEVNSPLNNIGDAIIERLGNSQGFTTTELLLTGIYAELTQARADRVRARLQAENQKTPLSEESTINPPARPRRPRKSLGE